MVPRLTQFLFPVTLLITAMACAQAPENLTDRDLRILQSLSLFALEPIPDSPSNRFADNNQAAELGKALFFDKALSIDGSLSCASCHQQDKAFTDGKPLAEGIDRTARNTPTLYGTAYLDWLYWDGRRDSLWSQALIPLEASNEMASSRVAAVRLVQSSPDYRKRYQALFGPLPDLDGNALPEHAAPIGDTARQNAWYRLPSQTQQQINTVFANLGKALGAFQRTIELPETRFDRFVAALNQEDWEQAKKLVSSEELEGIKLYIDDQRTQCLRCHSGPLLSNGGFHNIGTGRFSGELMDFGRVFGLQAVLMDEFNCLGNYSDAEADQCDALNHVSQDAHQVLQGAFKTPTLRYLGETAPYFHDGRFSSLEEVIDYYQSPPETGPNQLHELQPLNLTDDEKKALIAFLEMLN